jgi:acyl-CoA thioester hydrolase
MLIDPQWGTPNAGKRGYRVSTSRARGVVRPVSDGVSKSPPRHVLRSRVAWVDTDAGGRIHFTAAFRWAELAETALLRSLVLLDEWADYPRRAVEAEYLAVLRFDDEFELELVPHSVGTSSITYTWEITSGGELCIRGRHTAVHVDSEGRPAALPPNVRRALADASG